LYSIIMPRAATGSSATKRAHNEDALPEGKTRDKKAFQSKLEKEKSEQADGLEFEDPVEDEFEKEEIIDGDASDAEMAAEEEDAAAAGGTAVYRPGVDKVEEGEELVLGDPTMYTMLHRAEVEWPCLSFDTIQDNLGASRKKYPMTCYVVAGTQADTAKNNKIVVMKWSHMYKTNKDGDDEEEEEDDDEDEQADVDAKMDFRMIKHENGCINRIRMMPSPPGMAGGSSSQIAATWCEDGTVSMWNIASQLASLDGRGVAETKPLLYTMKKHATEGYGMAWNPHSVGQFASADCDGNMYLWNPCEGGWEQSKLPKSHQGSIEDIMWKKAGTGAATTMATAGVDGTIRLWDMEGYSAKPGLTIMAHDTDVNVISWNPEVGDLLLSGADDGSFKVWDVRNTGHGPMANFKWHRDAVTSVDWYPYDETLLAVASADNTVSLWDMSVEADDDEVQGGQHLEGEEDYPAQMMFLHQGQTGVKEVKFHPQLPGVGWSVCELSLSVCPRHGVRALRDGVSREGG
ncbi:hypothetical protein FOZ63_021336, partial [Perkinsus olseni]